MTTLTHRLPEVVCRGFREERIQIYIRLINRFGFEAVLRRDDLPQAITNRQESEYLFLYQQETIQ